ncbi:hypothetical protein JL722_13044 [Aureococcus anophagefferens]|nr:hypothetical protein JL722_13044 [Aureococcus anophagefferens]
MVERRLLRGPEFLKLEPMGYGEYDAMIVADLDYDPEDGADLCADFGPLFDCVAEGRVVTTRGPEVPVNGAFLAVPPSELLRSRLAALETARRLPRGLERRGLGPVWNSNLQPDFNVRICDSFDASSSAVLRELDQSNRFVQKSAESTSI